MHWRGRLCLLGAMLAMGGGSGAESGPASISADARQMARLWEALAGEDAVAGAAAADQLVAAGDAAADFVGRQLHQAVPPRKEIDGWILKLSHPAWSVRQEASQALSRAGLPARPLLCEAQKTAASEEVRGRIAQILSGFDGSGYDHPMAVPYRRAAAVLARIGTDRAIRVLRGLSAVAPCLEARDRCRSALRDIADGRIRSMLAAAEARYRSGGRADAAALCRRALSCAVEADDFRAGHINAIIERLASREPVAKSAWQLPTVDVLDLPDDVTMRLVLVPSGKFVMGSPATEIGREPDEEPQREVTISRAFLMGVFEVTQEQYQAVMGTNPSHFKGRLHPVHCATWYEAVAFCRRLSNRTGRTVRLPTEAEWEYACRAGTTTPFHTGRTLTAEQANYDGRMPYGSDKPGQCRGGTAPVGSYKPNAWGLYDMHGNVWEWCSDWHSESYDGAASVDPRGASTGSVRILRGGAWSYDANGCRSADRGYQVPDRRSVNFGFRVVVERRAGDGSASPRRAR